MKTLKELKPGTIFQYGGREFVVMEPAPSISDVLISGLLRAPVTVTPGVLVMDTKSVTRMAFREKYEDATKDQANNYAKSDIRRYLEEEYVPTLMKNGAKLEHLADMRLDLTATDGTTDYGRITSKVGLLTLAQFAKYYKHMPKDEENRWTWLLTPWATPSSPEPGGSAGAWSVGSDGSYSGGDGCSSACGVRPALSLDPGLFVSIPGDTSDLGSFTSDQLMDEVLRRREAEKEGAKE